MIRKFFFYGALGLLICGVLLIAIAMKFKGSTNDWEPVGTGLLSCLLALPLFFIAYCMKITGYPKWSAVASGGVLLAGLALQYSDQVARFFFDARLMGWQFRDALILFCLQIAVALLIPAVLVLFMRKLNYTKKDSGNS